MSIRGVSIRVQYPLLAQLPVRRDFCLYALVFLSNSSVRAVPIGVVGNLIRGDAFFRGQLTPIRK